MASWYKREIYEDDWKVYMKCPKCWEIKLASPDFWYRDKNDKLWYSSPCKECSKKSKKEYRDCRGGKEKIRAWRISYMDTEKWKIAKEKKYKYQKQYREKNKIKIAEDQRRRKGKHKVNSKTVKRIEKIWIRPNTCPLCWKEWDIIAHHLDYNKRYEIIFCCKNCHQRIHAWRFSPETEIVNLKDEIKNFYLLKLDKWIEKL